VGQFEFANCIDQKSGSLTGGVQMVISNFMMKTHGELLILTSDDPRQLTEFLAYCRVEGIDGSMKYGELEFDIGDNADRIINQVQNCFADFRQKIIDRQ
jgi:hypothetical protein